MEDRFVMLLTHQRAYLARYELHQRSWQRCALDECAVQVPLHLHEETDLAPLAETIADWVRQICTDGCVCRLIVPASWCLIHQVELAAERWNEQAALFEFEQFISIELDRLTCAFQLLAGRRALGAAVYTHPFRQFLQVFEDRCVHVEMATVDAFLVEHMPASAETAPDGIVFVDGRRLVISTLDSARQTLEMRLLFLPDSGAAELLAQQLATTVAIFELPCTRWQLLDLQGNGASAAAIGTLESLGGVVEQQSVTESVQQLLDAAAGTESLLDLRKEALAYSGRWTRLTRRSTRCAVAALAVMVAVAITIRVDHTSYAHAIDELRPVKQQVYQEVFPGQPVLPGAALRVRSERIKLQGLTQGRRGDAEAPLGTNGRELFEGLLAITEHIPEGLKLFVTEISGEPTGFKLVGRTTTHAAAGELVQSLNEIEGLVVDPPRTKLRKDGTVDFRVQARRVSHEETR